MTTHTLGDEETARLRAKHYNATVTDVRRPAPGLLILRVAPDSGATAFAAGQYTTLGLGEWEPGVEDHGPPEMHLHPAIPSANASLAAAAALNAAPALALDATAGKPLKEPKLIRRAYSISAPLVDEHGAFAPLSASDPWEFYIALTHPEAHEVDPHPRLTPKLFALAPGDRLLAGPKVVGKYTLERVSPDDDVIFCATGTGEAPHNAMISELLAAGHRGRIASLVCSRFREDLVYADLHRRLEKRFANYRWLCLTTRERENYDPEAPGYIGKIYLQDYWSTGALEKDLGWTIDPARTHVFLCGNPAMIGDPDAAPA
ncbi:MAG TPA: hypothetical protein VGE52_00610, partial [Pirellulales bacterium]